MTHHDKHGRHLQPHVRAAAIADREMKRAEIRDWYAEWLRIYREAVAEFAEGSCQGILDG